MPRKTLALISGLVLVTVILFIVALKNNTTTPTSIPLPTPITTQSQATPIVPVHSVLSLSPNPVTVTAGKQGSVAVNIDTSDNEVTAIQLEIAYDPNFITNVKVTPGVIFENPVLLINKNIVKEGRYTYAYGIMPNHPTIKGVGAVATITFTALNKSGPSQLALLPTSLVTAQGVSESVLKSASGTLIEVLPPPAIGASDN
jgi:hypothetical protein